MRLLRRDEILSAVLMTHRIPTPEWGEGSEVLVRALSGRQREAMDRHVFDNRQAGRPYSILGATAAYSIIDEDGQLMFSPEDILKLAELNQAPLERIWDWHARYSGLGGKSLEDALKNSGAGQNGVTSSV